MLEVSEVSVFWQEGTLTGHKAPVTAVALSRDGKRILSGSDDKLVKIWDTDTGAEVSLFCISFLRKGEVLAYVGHIHNLKDLKRVARAQAPGAVGGGRVRL